MIVRCKFKCTANTKMNDGNVVVMEPVTWGSKENDEFFKYTPFGKLEFGTINETAAAQFEPGKEYYIDIFPADPA